MSLKPIPLDAEVDASLHLVNYPPEAGFATVDCSTKSGNIRVTSNAGGGFRELEARPLAPVYNLNNTACGLNLTLPLGANGDKPETIAITFVNDSKNDASAPKGEVTVVVAVSFPPEENQCRVAVRRTLSVGASTFLHVVFNRVS